MTISTEKMDLLGSMIEGMLRSAIEEKHEYILLTFNEAQDKCDFISSMHPNEALPLIASWLRDMLKAEHSIGQASPSERKDN
jgi:hypothetical protein